jgi:predicted nucleotidyltransferase
LEYTQKSNYLYRCFCGPGIKSKDIKKKYKYIYKNCPRITAPIMKTHKLKNLPYPQVEEIIKYKNELEKIFYKYSLYDVLLTGSLARNQATVESDIDLSITSLNSKIEYSSIYNEVNELISFRVDLVDAKELYGSNIHYNVFKGDRILIFHESMGFNDSCI